MGQPVCPLRSNMNPQEGDRHVRHTMRQSRRSCSQPRIVGWCATVRLGDDPQLLLANRPSHRSDPERLSIRADHGALVSFAVDAPPYLDVEVRGSTFPDRDHWFATADRRSQRRGHNPYVVIHRSSLPALPDTGRIIWPPCAEAGWRRSVTALLMLAKRDSDSLRRNPDFFECPSPLRNESFRGQFPGSACCQRLTKTPGNRDGYKLALATFGQCSSLETWRERDLGAAHVLQLGEARGRRSTKKGSDGVGPGAGAPR